MDRLFIRTLADPSMPRIVVIQCPPQHGKSQYFSRWAAAWYLGTRPDNRLILASYNSSFARDWGRGVRDVLFEHGERYFGIRLRRDNKSASAWSIEGRIGGMQTSGPGSGTTGKPADLFIIDDPLKDAVEAQSEHKRQAVWDWYESVVDTRLQPGGVVVVIATRWHNEDLSGRLLAKTKVGGLPVSLLNLPALAEEGDAIGRREGEALWPSRFGRSFLEQKREGKTPYWWNALYQQRPTQHEGAEWPDHYFDKILTQYWPEQFEIEVAYLDPSKGKSDKSDFSAFVSVGRSGNTLWVDANIKRRPVPVIVRDGFSFVSSKRIYAFGVEANAFQDLLQPLFEHYARDIGAMPLPIIPITNTINKEVRIQRIGEYLQRGMIRIRDNEGGRLLLRQLKEFPIGDFDDGPDALIGGIKMLEDINRMQRRSDDTIPEIVDLI